VTLEPTRAGAYLCGALAGGLTTAALAAARDRSAGAALGALVGALVCGAGAVALEEWTRVRQQASQPQ
jgi:membrane protein involved in colicin uptake